MQILWEKPALLLEDAVIIGDLHIGLEQTLSYKGVHLPSSTTRMQEKIISIIKESKAKKLILLGDLKHRIASVSQQEAKEIPEFLETLSSHAEIIIVLGNHDGGLKQYLKKFEVHPSSGFVYKKQCLIHGSAKPLEKHLKKSDGIIASHWHPVYEFKDSLGGRNTEKIWVRAKAMDKPMLIIPSFNPLLGGVHVSRIKEKWVDLENAELYLMDGVFLGKMDKR